MGECSLICGTLTCVRFAITGPAVPDDLRLLENKKYLVICQSTSSFSRPLPSNAAYGVCTFRAFVHLVICIMSRALESRWAFLMCNGYADVPVICQSIDFSI